MSAGDEIVGYEVAAVEEWIRDNTQGLEPPFEWTQIGRASCRERGCGSV